MNFTLKVDGGEQLARNLNALSERLSRQIVREALKQAIEPMRGQTSQKARRAPGAPDLADHIAVSNAHGEQGDIAIAMGPTTERRSDQARRYDTQGRYLEYGTSRMPAFPFVRPAFDGEADATVKRLTSGLWQALIRRGFMTSRTFGGGGVEL